MAKNQLKLDFGRPVQNIIAQGVRKKMVSIAYKMTDAARSVSPYWSGQLINSWNCHDSKKYDNLTAPIDPATGWPEKEYFPMDFMPINILDYKVDGKKIPSIWVTNGKEYAFAVDQGVAPYAGEPAMMVNAALAVGRTI